MAGRGAKARAAKTTEHVATARTALVSLAETLALDPNQETDAELKAMMERIVGKAGDLARAEMTMLASQAAVDKSLQEWETERNDCARNKENEFAAEDAAAVAGGGERRVREPTVEDKLGSKLDNESVANVAKRIKTLIDDATKNSRVDKHKIVLDVKLALAAGEEESDDDADVRQIRAAPSGADFKCPISMMEMAEPMTNGQCPHHIDRSSFKSLFANKKKGQPVHCPVIGCSQNWMEASATLDVDFQRRMLKWRKSQAAGGGATQSGTGGASQVMDLVDEGGEYTEL